MAMFFLSIRFRIINTFIIPRNGINIHSIKLYRKFPDTYLLMIISFTIYINKKKYNTLSVHAV